MLPLQILRVGQLVLLIVPTEMTTMAGRRMRDHMKALLVENGVIGAEGVVIIAGLANGYADYTTTFEEYQIQRYEGGSTIFGPHQLNVGLVFCSLSVSFYIGRIYHSFQCIFFLSLLSVSFSAALALMSKLHRH